MRIAVLCNHPLAFLSIEALIKENLLVGLATPQIMHETTFRVQMIAESKGIKFAMIDPNDVGKSIEQWLKQIKADAVYVITFPYKIPEKVLDIPQHGFFNFHTGLLPAYRGPDPIFWQILNQENNGGVTVHQMDENFDTGPLVHSEAVPILPEDTYGQHIQKLAIAAKKCTEQVTGSLLTSPDGVPLYDQDFSKAAYQSKPSFQDLTIDWDKDSSTRIKSLTRASNPVYGGAITFFRGVPVHLLQVSVGSMKSAPTVKPGTIVSAGAKEGIVVLCSDNKLARLDVVYTEDGFFTGGKLASIFDIKKDEKFLPPPEQPKQ
ncbi:MAG TPA: formyltransferase family protein [Vampirovibrionales bacterium]